MLSFAVRIAVCLTLIPVSFAGIVTSVTCQAGRGPVVVSESSCSAEDTITVGSPPGPVYSLATFAAASVSTSLVMPTTPSDYVVAGIGVYLENDLHHLAGSKAGASAAMTFEFTTDGPVRSGFMEWDFSGFTEGVIIGWTTVNAGPVPVNCFFSAKDIPSCYQKVGYITPILLGQPFDFEMSRNVETPLHDWLVDDTARFSFRLFESDGVTGVAVQLVPEPATIVTAGLSLALLCAARRRVRRR